jgi:hypothetical protein
MIILMNKKAKPEQIDLVVETLKGSLNAVPIYVEREHAISVLPLKEDVTLSSKLLTNLPGIEKIIDNELSIVN